MTLLDDEHREKLVNELEEYSKSKSEEEPLRYHKHRICYYKTRAQLLELEADPLLDEYQACVEHESEPEKGERLVADDYVILAAERLELDQTEASDSKSIDVLRAALDKSPYNFDLNMKLAWLYERWGMVDAFKENYEKLNMKGVQLESLGFMVLRLHLGSGNQDFFNSILQKYDTYRMWNNNDMQSLLIKSIADMNYAKNDEFIDFKEVIDYGYYRMVYIMLKSILIM